MAFASDANACTFNPPSLRLNKKKHHKKINKKLDLILEKVENLDNYEALQKDLVKFIRVLGEDIHRIETFPSKKSKVQEEIDNKIIDICAGLIQDLTLMMEEPGRYSDAEK